MKSIVCNNLQNYKFTRIIVVCGELSEWFKVHPWKGCVVQNATGGSNPPLSATYDKFMSFDDKPQMRVKWILINDTIIEKNL